MNDIGVIQSTVMKKLDQTFYEMISGAFYVLGTFGFFALLLLSTVKSFYSKGS